MSRFRIFLETPVVCLALTGIFTIGMHTASWTVILSAPTAQVQEAADTRSQEEMARDVIRVNCCGCHQSGRSGIDFPDDALDLVEMRRNRADWELVVKKLRSNEMPPRKFPQPTPEERSAAIAWIEREVLQASGPIGQEKLMARRLQRTEYVNTIRDLFGIQFQPAADFPKDEANWNKCSDLADLSPVLMEKYRSATEKILEQATAAELQRDRSPTKEGADLHRAALLPLSNPHLFSCDCSDKTPADNAREMFTSFLRRAYRQAADPVEVEHLVALFERAEADGESYEDGIRAALSHVLTSPRFLYRIEARDDAEDQFALASRLAFFLWRSAPDETLLDLAEQGELMENVEGQVKRMLQDSRAHALAQEFAAAWLSLDKLDSAPNLEEPLRRAMRQETELFVAAMVREDRDVLEFLNADYTFVNQLLAEHYGIPGVRGDAMRRVSLKGTPRGGLLTHASTLVITSALGDSSPVNRGKWVLEKLFGSAPIRPPAGLVQALENTDVRFGPGNLRKQLEQHRANPSCAQCHAKMDAIGLSLENFDSRGAWRTIWSSRPVEPIGTLPDGETLNGVEQARAYLMKHREQFVRAFGEHLLRFALGRKLDERDRAALASIPENAGRHDYRFSSILLDVVRSDPFQQGVNYQKFQAEQPKEHSRN